MLFTGLGRAVLGKTVPSVSSTEEVGETVKKNWKSYVFILDIVSSTCQQMYNKMNWSGTFLHFYEKVEQ